MTNSTDTARAAGVIDTMRAEKRKTLDDALAAVIDAAPPVKKKAYIAAVRAAERARRKASDALFAAFYAAPESVQQKYYAVLDAAFDTFPPPGVGDKPKRKGPRVMLAN